MDMTHVTLMLVDDHDVVRIGTRALLEGSFTIVGEADNAQSAIELSEERNPNVVLLDVRLPGGGGAVVAKHLKETRPGICIVAFTVSLKHDDVRAMMTAGVDGYLTKTTHAEELTGLIQRAIEGGRPVSPEVAGFLLDIDDDIQFDSPISGLTSREREGVRLIASGHTYRDASTYLGISPKTLENHMGSIFRKLGIASRHQLAAKIGPSYLHPDSDE